VRIVGGEFRGRTLATPSGHAIRPTSDRLRQTIFDILAHAYGNPARNARVLDLFAGTGAMGLEAMSRGADFVLFVEDGIEARGLIRRNAEALGVTGRSRVFRRDATRLGAIGSLAPFTLAFVDPPYARSLGEKALASAIAGGWLAPGAVVVLEESAAAEISPVTGLSVEEVRTVSDSQLVFLRALPSAAGDHRSGLPQANETAKGSR
jgi:16S rRNA (guanine966-N2)-methyltransferase